MLTMLFMNVLTFRQMQQKVTRLIKKINSFFLPNDQVQSQRRMKHQKLQLPNDLDNHQDQNLQGVVR